MISIKKKIEQHFSTLSKSQQKVANFVLNNPSFISMHSAAEVGKKAGASETTVIRFCYSVGLDGYVQLQQKWREYLFEHNTNSTLGNYVASKKALPSEQLCEKVMGQMSKQIANVATQIDPQQFHEVTKKIHEAGTIYLIGAGGSIFATQWLQFTLNMLRPGVKLVHTDTSTLIRTLQEVDETAVAIVVSLHRYYKEPIEIAEQFQQRGAYIIAITDTNVAPIHPYAHETFVLQQVELSTIDLMPVLMAFLNTLVAGMMSHDIPYYNQQRINYDDFQNSFLANRWS